MHSTQRLRFRFAEELDAAAIQAGLSFLLERLPPMLHLVIASRAEPPLPLARLRARGELSELRALDLRFTPDEAASFLTEMMDLPLSAEEVAALERRTEGWIAGLQLAALAMRERHDLAGFISAFTGSHRFVGEYLVEEVFARQPNSDRARDVSRLRRGWPSGFVESQRVAPS